MRREGGGDVRWRLWNWIWSGCKGIGSARGRVGCGRKSRRKKKKNLNRDPGDIILEGCGPE